MNNFPLIGVGITTKGKSGKTLDAYFPFILFQNGKNKLDKHFQQCNDLIKNDLMQIENINLLDIDDEEFNNSFTNLETNKIIVLCRISGDKPINSIEEAYLKLHLISVENIVYNV